MEEPKKTKTSIIKIGVGILLLIAGLYFAYYLVNIKRNNRAAVPNMAGSANPSLETDMDNADQKRISEYKNEEFGFKVDYSTLLFVNELGAQGGYIHFVRFEEEYTGRYEGFAIGVSLLSFEKELGRIKSGFAEDDNAILESEADMEFKGLPAKSLLYKPKSDAQGEEEREVVVVSRGEYTYSLSTTPEEMPTLIERFSFI